MREIGASDMAYLCFWRYWSLSFVCTLGSEYEFQYLGISGNLREYSFLPLTNRCLGLAFILKDIICAFVSLYITWVL